MRITILTAGTRGDVVPFVALGQGLKAAGHDVQLASHRCFTSLVNEGGLQAVTIAGNPREINEGQAGQALLESGSNPIRFARWYARAVEPLVEEILLDSWQVCQGSEAIVANPPAFYSYDIAEKLGVPFYMGGLVPLSANPDFPIATMPDLGRFFSLYNHLTYPLVRLLIWQLFRQPINQWRQSTLKLSPLSVWQDPFDRMERQGVPYLYGYSAAVLPRPATWSDNFHVTGYWFLDRADDWTPPPGLVRFLAAGSPPVYIGFGSMKGANPEITTNIVLKALTKTGQRGILLTGWGGLGKVDLPDTVFQLDFAPHDWLFPQVSAAVHHGGAGTTAAALRAGIPSVVVPFFADQSFWGYRLAQLGLGAQPIPKKQLSAESLATAIRSIVCDRALRHRTATISKQIQAEDGVAEAVKAFHQHLSSRQLAIEKH